MAQWLAQDSYKVKVPGSSPGWCTVYINMFYKGYKTFYVRDK